MLHSLVRSALVALYPAQGELPGIADCDVDGFLSRFRRETTSLLWLGCVAGAVLFQLTPLLTLGLPLPAFLLSGNQRDKHADRFATTRIYPLRQLALVLKLVASFCWGADARVRKQWGLAPYPKDPRTRRYGEHIPFSDKAVTLDVDVVVVGSGAGGATAAARLARKGAKVALVEAGPWRNPEDYPSSVYGGMRDLMDNWGTTVARGRAFSPVVQARCVGGTTVVNSAICVRTPKDVFARWEKELGVDGAELEEQFGMYQDELERALGVERPHEEALGRSNRLALAGAGSMQFHSEYTLRYAKRCSGTGQCLQGCKSGKKQSLNLNFVPYVLEKGGHVLSCAPVTRILFDGTRAIGVEGTFENPETHAKGGKFSIRAKTVIIAASATMSPVLLMQSGVRHPGLGAGFRAHPGTGVFGVYDEPVDMNIGTTQGWASTHFRDEPGFKLESLAIPPELVASRLSGGGTTLIKRLERYRHLAMWCLAVRAESVGSVSRGINGAPVVKYGLDAADMKRLRHGMVQLARAHVAAGAKSILPGIFGFDYELDAGAVEKMNDAPLDPRAYTLILSHLFGGCTMGTVVDSRGKVNGYEGLYVADASVIPTNLGVNPQHTIMAMASRVADSV